MACRAGSRQLWFKAEKEGIYFGQCSELCGKDHAYMPITVKVVSRRGLCQLAGRREGGRFATVAALARPVKVAAAD